MVEKRDISTLGTEFKIQLKMEPIDGQTLSDLDFSVVVHTDRYNKRQIYNKKDCILMNDDTYAVPVDSAELGPGRYYVTVTVYIPDTHFIEGVRKDVSTYFSGKEIIP